MKKRHLIISFIAFLIFLALIYAYFSADLLENSVSPNNKWKVEVKSSRLPFLPLDSHYYFFLSNLETNEKERQIWVSPDENKRVTFRVVWSKNDSKFLISGQNLILFDEKLKLASGEGVYFLFDTSTNEKWCNCNDTREKKIDLEKIKDEFDFEQ